MILIEATRRAADVDAAAQIWAEATAARDSEHEVASLDISRPLIQTVLDRSDRALLLIARESGPGNGLRRQRAAAGHERDPGRGSVPRRAAGPVGQRNRRTAAR